MKRIKSVVTVIVFAIAMLGIGLAAGCAKTTLAPNGVYQGDTFLYQAENTINIAHDSFKTFLQWETTYRSVLPVEVSHAADYVRLNEQKWISSANALHDAYKNTPTAENKDKFQLALNIIDTALHEAAGYMIGAKANAPNNGLPNVKSISSVSAPPSPR
jgi:hypothetical protein